MDKLGCAAILAAVLTCAAPPSPAVETPPSTTTGPPDTSWPSYNLDLAGDRFADIAQINPQNAARLREVCRVRVDEAGSFQSALVLVDGVIYVTTSTTTTAINPTDCGVVWKNVYTPAGKQTYPNNRGPAVADGRVYRGTTDCRLLALNAKTGEREWLVNPCNPDDGEWLAAAPVVWQHEVFIGIAGGDFGVQGRVFAFDAATGKQLWEFNTIPKPGEFGADTWKGATEKPRGGGTWTSYALDPETGEFFVPVGNPTPLFEGRVRPGANLFTNSILVLDAQTGHLKWWYQALPHDTKDFDFGAPPMLFTLKNGRKLVAAASKDGHVYVIDRRTHELLRKIAVTTILNQDEPVTTQGLKVCPGVVGGTEWNGPALDRLNQAIVVGAVDWCTLNKLGEKSEFTPGQFYLGGTFEFLRDPPPSGWITSVDQETGKVRWSFHAPAPVVSGVTPTAGGLVFAGDMNGNFYALDSADGTIRFEQKTPGAIGGGVITYRIKQRQYVALTSGNLSRVVWGDAGVPHVIIYALGDSPNAAGVAMAGNEAAASAAAAVGAVPVSGGAGSVRRGKALFTKVCVSCHGNSGEGVAGPALKNIAGRKSVDQIEQVIKSAGRRADLPNGGLMPMLYPSVLTDSDVTDVAAYVHTLK